MQRDRDALLLGEMIDAAEQIQELAKGVTVELLAADRQLRDALLWNFTVLGEASVQVSDELMNLFPIFLGGNHPDYGTASCMGIGQSTWRSFTQRRRINYRASRTACDAPWPRLLAQARACVPVLLPT